MFWTVKIYWKLNNKLWLHKQYLTFGFDDIKISYTYLLDYIVSHSCPCVLQYVYYFHGYSRESASLWQTGRVYTCGCGFIVYSIVVNFNNLPLPCVHSTKSYEQKHKQMKQPRVGEKSAIIHLLVYSNMVEKNCSSLHLFQLYREVGVAEHTRAWHPGLKWTDTINPVDSGDPLTEQDKVSASTHCCTRPVAHKHSLALMAYVDFGHNRL